MASGRQRTSPVASPAQRSRQKGGMFERLHHKRIAQVLVAVDGEELARHISRDLAKAIDRAEQRTGCLERCMQVIAVQLP